MIGGLVLLVFLHELGHFSVALAVGMRPRSFYIGFPPALVKVRRNGIEYGIGMIPLGGLVRIPGMHRPAARDLQVFIEPGDAGAAGPRAAGRRSPARPRGGGLRGGAARLPGARARGGAPPTCRRARGARRERALRDLEEGTAPDAYWRAPTWKRVAVIAAGPLANILLAFLILFIVFAVSGGPSLTADQRGRGVEAGTPAAAAGLQRRRPHRRRRRPADPHLRRRSRI